MGFFWTIVTLVVALALAWRYLGSYMAAVFDGRLHFLGWAERPVYSLLGTSPDNEQSWQRYAGSMIIFSAYRMCGSPTSSSASRARCPSTPSTSGR